MKKVRRNLVVPLVVLLAIGLLSGCGANRRKAKAVAMKRASETNTTIAVLEAKVESQQTRIEALEREIAELRKQ